VRGNTQTSKQKREELARAAGRGIAESGSERVLRDGIAFKYSAGAAARSMPTYSDGSVNTLTADYHAPAVATAIRTANSGANGSGISDECAHTIDCAQPEAVAFVGNYGGDTTLGYSEECSPTMTAKNPVDVLCMADDTQNAAIDENLSGTLKVGGGTPLVAYSHPAERT
jgi:hypothetical protein